MTELALIVIGIVVLLVYGLGLVSARELAQQIDREDELAEDHDR